MGRQATAVGALHLTFQHSHSVRGVVAWYRSNYWPSKIRIYADVWEVQISYRTVIYPIQPLKKAFQKLIYFSEKKKK